MRCKIIFLIFMFLFLGSELQAIKSCKELYVTGTKEYEECKRDRYTFTLIFLIFVAYRVILEVEFKSNIKRDDKTNKIVNTKRIFKKPKKPIDTKRIIDKKK